MSMSHVILGLLMLWPQSLYELKKNFESGVSLFYSASTGSIKRALDQLLAADRITVEASDGSRGKKLYAVTDAGREEFLRWMHDDIAGSDLETAILPRAFFLGLLDTEERPAIASHIRQRIRADLERFEQLQKHTAATEIPAGLEEVAHYQRATLQYGLDVHHTALSWADEHLP
ncbi:helix-turn-helix transcriptional regulator [Auritidibacter ignavus]|uniref:Helix-turn-helix transcriptional regulator n=1 Tax=Auritidibacter ignavus TaxID=678932 RepID=A0AAJ6AMU5_9MICC|nr:helix-turn-helix transcriptional regulator [Auritidibacter ignavus]WGH92965.1 helix-turn-helix transcriptional regulator [Auritidibacter ignavus]